MSDIAMGDIPGIHQAAVRHIAVGTTDATRKDVIFRAPFACLITGVSWIPDVAVTGADTNSRNLNINDEGLAGIGDAEIANIDFASGQDAVALDELAVTMSSANHALQDGDVLTAEWEKVGTGLAAPAGMFVIYYKANPAEG